ncbi:hypothetical protein [Candidatus Rhabdochlamydia sp. T3358]|uniref:hypothetical protein n=1 Tax=Candidatus Rhabdochlamydia sp. T3358 TaxID=2099795 RepID=UPI0010B9CDC9|nr:hypothetical protein [Candidatus Rhabdochlamydia sp. T3358]VHO03593.1 hypothetical protein RHT_00957 [Candidatus Rhabdochlamydia sp. T3358]
MSLPIPSSGASSAGSSRGVFQSDEVLAHPSASSAICQRVDRVFTATQLGLLPLGEKRSEALVNYPTTLAGGIANLCVAGGIDHDFTPAEERDFKGTMRAIQHPVKNKITKNGDGTDTIEFRPKHGLADLQGLESSLEVIGKFAGGFVSVEQRGSLNKKEFSYSSIVLENYQDLATQRYKQLWEDRYPENLEDYEVPENGHPNSTLSWVEKSKTVDELERELSYQKRFFLRVINIMNNKQRESDRAIPFDPAFKRIFILSNKDLRDNKVALFIPACLTAIFFEYKIKTVPSHQVKADIEEIDAMPTWKIREICKKIKTSLKDDPIKMVDLHQISHLLEKLGAYASSSALVEREYTIDKEERHCTAIVLRNYQDLVDERYSQIVKKSSLSDNLPHEPPKCNHPMSFLCRKRELPDTILNNQKNLIERAVQELHNTEGKPFDPLFERIYIPTDQERLDNGVSISNIAQTDTILFVYAKQQNKNASQRTVKEVCKAIKEMAEVEKIEIPIAETSLIRTAAEASLPLIRGTGQALRFFLSGRRRP